MRFLTDCKADATVEAQGSLVLTLNRDNREEEVRYVLSYLPTVVEKLRFFSPVWRQKMAEAAGAPR